MAATSPDHYQTGTRECVCVCVGGGGGGGGGGGSGGGGSQRRMNVCGILQPPSQIAAAKLWKQSYSGDSHIAVTVIHWK